MTSRRATPFGSLAISARTRAPLYVAVPESGSGPGVIVLHEARGLSPDIIDTADRLAEAGYLAVAPDLVSAFGNRLSLVAEVVKGSPRVARVVGDVIDWTVASGRCLGGMTGVIGFSLGGALALLADRHPSVAVISANYSIVPPNAWAVRPVPVVASFGGDDRLLPRGGGRLRRMARASGIAHDILTYGGAGHSFMTGIGPLQEQSRSGRLIGAKNHPVASADAWERTLRFFDRHLSSVATRCDSDGLAASAG